MKKKSSKQKQTGGLTDAARKKIIAAFSTGETNQKTVWPNPSETRSKKVLNKVLKISERSQNRI